MTGKQKNVYFCHPFKTRYRGRVARRRSAKPYTAVRIRSVPQKNPAPVRGFFINRSGRPRPEKPNDKSFAKSLISPLFGICNPEPKGLGISKSPIKRMINSHLPGRSPLPGFAPKGKNCLYNLFTLSRISFHLSSPNLAPTTSITVPESSEPT